MAIEATPDASRLAPARRLTSPGVRRWARLLATRVLLFVITLWLVLTLTWILTRVVGGNPAVKLAGPQPTPETIKGIEIKLGLDQPLLAQYFTYLGNLLQGDLGTNFFTDQSVAQEVRSRAPATIQLVALSGLIALVLGIVLGVASALRRGTAIDQGSRVLSVLALSTPDFFLGLLFAYFLFYKLRWFPAPIGQLPVGVAPPASVTGFTFVDGFLAGRPAISWAFLKQMALPALSLGLIYFAPIFRLTRSSMLESLRSDSVLYAEACGLRRQLVTRYALRQSMTLVVTFLGILLAALIGGDVLIEQVYSWGGLGQYGVDAVTNNNYPAVQAFVLVVGVIALLIYTVVDLLYVTIDPRVRLS